MKRILLLAMIATALCADGMRAPVKVEGGLVQGAVESDLRGAAASDTFCAADILDDINQRLAGFGLADGVLGVVVFHFEVDAFRATSSFRGRDHGRFLGKSGNREKNQNNGSAHNFPPN